MKKRKQDIASLKISTQDKQRLHKRREIIISMKFIRILGKRLRDDLEKQGVVIRKLQRSRTIRMNKQMKNTSFRDAKKNHKKQSQDTLSNFGIQPLIQQQAQKAKSPNDLETALSPLKYDLSRIQRISYVTPAQEKLGLSQPNSVSGSNKHLAPPPHHQTVPPSLDVSINNSSRTNQNIQPKPFTERNEDLRLDVRSSKNLKSKSRDKAVLNQNSRQTQAHAPSESNSR